MNYIKIKTNDVANGVGVRVSLWLSGCSHHCEGCQNPETWDKNAGKPFDEEAKQKIFNELSKPYIKGLTVSGGDPLSGWDEKSHSLFYLLGEIKEKFPDKDIWMWTGYTWEELYDENSNEINIAPLLFVDVLVDGRFEIDKRDITLEWRGSSNQRIIDVQRTLMEGHGNIILWKDGQYK